MTAECWLRKRKGWNNYDNNFYQSIKLVMGPGVLVGETTKVCYFFEVSFLARG